MAVPPHRGSGAKHSGRPGTTLRRRSKYDAGRATIACLILRELPNLRHGRESEMSTAGARTARKAYGTVGVDRQSQMSGLGFVQGLVDGTLPLNTMAETLGYDIVEVTRGRVVITCEPNGS